MFELRHYNNILVMQVSGDLGLKNVRHFDSVLNLILQEEIEQIVLDFSELHHMDYKLVPHLLDRIIEVQCLGGELKLAGMNRYISDILKAMGFEEETYPSVEDAVISFSPVRPEEWQ